ncbi:MAG TPA: nitrilase-related carbon-nitrogen hydrolase [Phycisphaerae bacterium]|nr:nitrilase-related carbon-nitrogen hydrolase [Phycisphaerae bacterium]
MRGIRRGHWVGVGLAVVLASAGGAYGQARASPASWSPHDPPLGRAPIVTALAVSADGQRLAAAYYRPPMNRPGTDWDAWVATWDLASGGRTILRGACAPIALSPDGRWLAARRYERARNPGYVADPAGEMTLWPFGADEAAGALGMPETPATAPAVQRAGPARAESGDGVRAVTFAADSARVLGLAGDGRILAWPVDSERREVEVGRIAFDDLVLPSGRQAFTSAALERTSRGLLAIVPVRQSESRFRPDQAAPYAMAVQWRWKTSRPDQLEQTEVYPFASDVSQTNAQSVVRTLSFGQEPSALPLRGSLFRQFAEPRRTPEQDRWVALGPKAESLALSDMGLIRVHKMRGPEVAHFPGVGPMRFMPDGKRLVAASRTGVLRVWDVAAGAIVRSLRLDDRPAETFRVAAVQCDSEFGDPEKNRKALSSWIYNAARAGADIVVLPETAVTGYMSPDLKRTWQVGDRPITPGLTGVDPRAAAEPVPGPSTRFFAELARRYGIYLTVPLLESDVRTGRYYNTVVLLGPDGSMLTHYRKLNPWPWAEKGWASPGDLGHPVADTPFGRVGTLVCFDIHEQASAMAERKVDTLLYSIAWVDSRGSDWFPQKLPQIAARNGFHMVGANWTVPPARQGDAQPDWHGYGQSCVISAAGKVLAKARDDRRGDVVLADLPLPGAAKTAP